MSNPLLNEEELKALALLAEHHRLSIMIVPEDVTDEFMARLTTWNNFVMDTKLLPPLTVPGSMKGDGLVCPYCEQPASQNIQLHLPTCAWKKAVTRWAMSQIQIDEEFAKNPRRADA